MVDKASDASAAALDDDASDSAIDVSDYTGRNDFLSARGPPQDVTVGTRQWLSLG